MEDKYCFDYDAAVERYGSMVFKLARVSLHNKQDAEDVFQEVFLKLYRHSAHIESDEHLKAWLLRVTINQCHSQARASYRREELPSAEPKAQIGEGQPLADHSGHTLLADAIGRLPEKYRQIVWLHYFEGLSVKELAELLELNENTVKTRLSRARGLLAGLLAILILLLLAAALLFYARESGAAVESVPDAEQESFRLKHMAAELAAAKPEYDGHEYILKLPEGGGLLVDHAAYSTWQRSGDDSDEYILLINSTRVSRRDASASRTAGGRSELRASAPAYALAVTDSSGNAYPATATELERSDDGAEYEIRLLLQLQDGKLYHAAWAKLIVATDADGANARLLGIYLEDMDDGSLTEFTIPKDSDVLPYRFTRHIAYDAEGNILPFDEWEGKSDTLNGFVLEGELGVCSVPIADSADVCVVFSVHDAEGNSYWSDISGNFYSKRNK